MNPSSLIDRYKEILSPVQQGLSSLIHGVSNVANQAYQHFSAPLPQSVTGNPLNFQQPILPQLQTRLGNTAQGIGSMMQQFPRDNGFSTPGALLSNFLVADPIRSMGATVQRAGQGKLFNNFSNGLEDAGNIAQVLPMGSIASKGIKGVETVLPGTARLLSKIPLAEEALPAIKNAASNTAIKDIYANATKGGPDSVVSGATKSVGILDSLFNRTRNIIAQQGEHGQELAQRILTSRDVAESNAGKWVQQLPTVRKLNNDEFVNFVDAAEGKTKPLSDKISQAVSEWSNVRDQIYNTANQSGAIIGKQEDYFPHTFDPKMFEGDNFAKMAQHLVDSGQANTIEGAAQLIRHIKDISRNRRMGNLEISRYANLPGYEKTPQALFDYISKASHRISQVQHFGKDDSIAMGLIGKMAESGHDATAAKEAFDIASGAKQYSDSSRNISGVLRSIEGTTKLGLSAISNTGQSVNTATVTGALRTLGSIPEALSPSGREFALKSGATLDSVLSEFREGSGFGNGFVSKVLGKVTAPGFNTVERFNRTLAAVAGKNYAQDLATQAAKGSKSAQRSLLNMGITDFTKGLSEADQIKAAQNIVRRTQFKVDPQDLPGWASSPYGKLFAQFKSFTYNQGAFVKNEIVDPLKSGNVMPLTRFLVLGLIAGEGIADTKAAIRGRQRETNPISRGLDNLSTVGGGGIIQDAYSAMQRGPDAVLQWIAGPVLGDVSKAAGGIGMAAPTALGGQGKPKTLGKFALNQIPLVGQSISNSIYPPANTYKARTPDLPIDQVSAADFPQAPLVNANQVGQQSTPNKSDMNILEKKDIQQKITDINKKEKDIYNKPGALNLPVFGQVSGLNDNQKTSQLTQLEAQKKSLQDQLKKPKIDYRSMKLTGNPELDKTLISKQSAQLTTMINDTLKDYSDGKITAQQANDTIAQIKQAQKGMKAINSGPKKLKQIKFKTPKIKAITVRKAKKPKDYGKISSARIKVRKVKLT